MVESDRADVKKLLGVILFFIGLGMMFGLLITDTIIVIIAAAVCMLFGYHFFCS